MYKTDVILFSIVFSEFRFFVSVIVTGKLYLHGFVRKLKM